MIATAILCSLLCAVTVWFGTGLHPVFWATWLMALPALHCAKTLPARFAALAVFTGWFVGSCNQTHYLLSVLGLPIWLVVLSPFGNAAIFTFAAMRWRKFVKSKQPIRAAFLFAAIWTVYEFIRFRTSIHGTIDNLAYSQLDFLPIAQLASVTGLCGVGFFVFFTQGLLAGRRPLPALLLVGVVCLGGWIRMQGIVGVPVKVGLVTSDQKLPQDQLLDRYALEAQQLISAGAQAVLLPEKIVKIQDAERPTVDSRFQEASQHGVIIVGIERWTTEDKRNEARVYSRGLLKAVYEKQHMLPPFESHLLVGKDRVSWDVPTGKWGTAICKDMGFPDLGRGYGNDGVGLMLIPAYDFVEDAWYADRVAMMRGVESGFSVVRAPRAGNLIASDQYGRVLAEKASNRGSFPTLFVSVPSGHLDTLYNRFGDWFCWTISCLLPFVWFLRRRPHLR